MTYSDDSPQTKAAKASGQARRERAERRKAAEARQQRYVEEHQRGEHADDVWVGCPLCKGPQDRRINPAGAYVIKSIDGPSRGVDARKPRPGYQPPAPTEKDRALVRALLADRTGNQAG